MRNVWQASTSQTRYISSRKFCLLSSTFALAVFISYIPSDVRAQTVSWTGYQSSNWSAGQNWSTGSAPANKSTININDVTLNSAIANGVQFTGQTLNIGTIAGSHGSLELTDGANLQMNRVYVGSTGTGLLSVTDSVVSASGGLEVGSSNYGKLIISGETASLSVNNANTHFNIGNQFNGDGHAEILNGATVNVWNVSLGNLRGSGSLTVDGEGSLLAIDGRDLSAAGQTGDTSIIVSNGGKISISSTGDPSRSGLLELGSNGQKTYLLVTGKGSELSASGDALIAEFGTVRARIEDQAKLTLDNNLIVGDGSYYSGSDGEIVIDNLAQVNVAKDTVIGLGYATGVLTLSNKSNLTSAGIYIAAGTPSTGTLNIGAAAGDIAQAAGELIAPEINFGDGAGKLVFNHTAVVETDAYAFNQKLIGHGKLEHYAGFTHLTTVDNSSFVGTSVIYGGTMRVDGVLGGVMTVEQPGRLQGIGTVGSTINRGTIAPGNSFGTLTIDGDYTGENGSLEIETALGNDMSLTDKLVINGSTSGSSTVKVLNVGGEGAATVEGIKIIQVSGSSDGAFSLLGVYTTKDGAQAVVGGAYAYTLHQNGISTPDDGNWYLRSELIQGEKEYQAGAAVYEAYPQALLGLNSVSTLQQRVGNRSWTGNGNTMIAEGADIIGTPYAAPEEAGTAIEGNGLWMRVEGGNQHIKSASSTTGTDYNQNVFKLQTGLDGVLSETENGKLLGGIMLQYVHGKTKTNSNDYANGEISTDGYGFGGTLTWYNDNGFYVDGQAQVTWYKSDLTTTALGAPVLFDDNKGLGYTVSLETGKRIAIDPEWSMTPQAQLIYSHVDFDDFTDGFGSDVSLNKGESVQGRLGLTLDHQKSWQNANGLINRSHVYGITNLYYEFMNGTKVDVASVSFANKKDRFWGGLGVGGSYNWDNGKYSVYGEGLVNTSLNNFGDSYSLKGNVGFRVKW